MLISSGKPGRAQVLHMGHLSTAERRRLHGTVELAAVRSITAGADVTLKFTYTAGEGGLPTGSRLRIAWRWPFDWPPLQTADPSAANYATAAVQDGAGDGVASLELQHVPRGDLDPWNHHLELTVTEGEVPHGQRVDITCGDRSARGSGWRAPTFTCKRADFMLVVNTDGTDQWVRLVGPESTAITPGSAEGLKVMAPTDVACSESFTVYVRAEDTWGNPTPLEGSAIPGLELRAFDGAGALAEIVPTVVEEAELLDDPPVYRFRVNVEQGASVVPIVSSPDGELAAEGNPIRVHRQVPARRLFWGDLHSGQTEIGCGAGSLEDHFRFARYAAGLQFASQQANDHYVTVDDWEAIRALTSEADTEGEFVALLGCEWSPPTEDGGDNPDSSGALCPASSRWWRIHSTHGTSEWFVQDALSRGYRVGITAGTDGVAGRPGADHPGWRQNRNLRSGLTAVYAEDLSKESLWAAFRERRCYATTGERIILRVEADGRTMGEEYETSDAPEIRVSAVGTAAIERLDLFRDTMVVKSWPVARPSTDRGDVRLLWGGTEKRGTAAAQRVCWDGRLTVTGGQVSEVRSVGFHSPEDSVRRDEAGVVWRSVTAGNRAGLVLKIDGDDRTACRFVSEPCEFEFELGRVRQDALRVDAGGVGRTRRGRTGAGRGRYASPEGAGVSRRGKRGAGLRLLGSPGAGGPGPGVEQPHLRQPARVADSEGPARLRSGPRPGQKPKVAPRSTARGTRGLDEGTLDSR